MILTLIATLALASPSQDPTLTDAVALTPGQVVSKMLARYNDAKTMVAQIRFTQSAANVSVITETRLQFERPTKIYLAQQRNGSEARSWLLTADGKAFSYDRPDGVSGGVRDVKRMVENVRFGAVEFTIKDMYGAATRSIGDKSAPLDMLIGRLEDLRYLRNQWASMDFAPAITHNGRACYTITGKWRAYGEALPTGEYEMLIDKESHNLMRFRQREMVTVRGSNVPPVEVLSVWDVDARVDAPVDSKLFVLVR